MNLRLISSLIVSEQPISGKIRTEFLPIPFNQVVEKPTQSTPISSDNTALFRHNC